MHPHGQNHSGHHLPRQKLPDSSRTSTSTTLPPPCPLPGHFQPPWRSGSVHLAECLKCGRFQALIQSAWAFRPWFRTRRALRGTGQHALYPDRKGRSSDTSGRSGLQEVCISWCRGRLVWLRYRQIRHNFGKSHFWPPPGRTNTHQLELQSGTCLQPDKEPDGLLDN